MTDQTSAGPGGSSAPATYDPTFAAEVFEKVDSGEEIKMCMQCGVCAASCPLSQVMDFSPRKIFTLIRAGRRDEVLSSRAILLCTSCYACKVRCPRKVPVVDVMHGLARYAIVNGYATRPETQSFGTHFWGNIYKLGRVDEKDVSRKYFFRDGLFKAPMYALKMADIGLKMMLRRRMKLLPERPIRGIVDLRKMLDKAAETGKGRAG
jgi:quinone-modifying oxidoreductase subunit QmoC